MLKVTGLFVLVDAPDHPVKVYPSAAHARASTVVPASCGVAPINAVPLINTAPPDDGFALTVSVYTTGVNIATSVLPPSIVISTDDDFDVDAPDHPLNV